MRQRGCQEVGGGGGSGRKERCLGELPRGAFSRREADRVILTTCQARGAHADTFNAISQQLRTKTAEEVGQLGVGWVGWLQRLPLAGGGSFGGL